MSSKDKPILGPRDVDQRERYIYGLNDFYRNDRDALIEAGIVVAFAGIGKALLKTDIIGVGSMKKATMTFATVLAAGMVANRLKGMTSDRLASVIPPPK